VNLAVNAAELGVAFSCFEQRATGFAAVLRTSLKHAISGLNATATFDIACTPCAPFAQLAVHRAGSIVAFLDILQLGADRLDVGGTFQKLANSRPQTTAAGLAASEPGTPSGSQAVHWAYVVVAAFESFTQSRASFAAARVERNELPDTGF
jgi:hypothetical protein